LYVFLQTTYICLPDYSCWHTNRSRPIRHITQDDRHGTDAAAITYAYCTQHLRIGTELDVVPYHRYRTIGHAITYGHALA